MASQSVDEQKLAIQGGFPAKREPDPPMFPGGMMVDEEEEQAVLEVLRSKRLFRFYGPTPGPSKVSELEETFAAFVGRQHSLAVTSGTAALICGLQGIGVGPGDEVIVPAYTWIASATAAMAVGAVPVIAEVDESLTLDPDDVERKITPYTRAIMPVHMRGAPCRMEELMSIARRHDLKVIEDTAQANGASYQGRRLGTFGDVGCFSLQFNKIITSGEGGMVVSDDPEVWKRAFLYHDVIAWKQRGIEPSEALWGINFRMPELSAAVGLVQLRRLDGLLSAMRARKQMLKTGIEETAQRNGVQFRDLTDPDGDAAVALILYVESPAKAGEIVHALRAENIGASLLYEPDIIDYHVYAHWIPVIEQRLWSAQGGPWRWGGREIQYAADMCPRSLDLLGRSVHLNVSPLLSNEDVEETIEGVNRVVAALA